MTIVVTKSVLESYNLIDRNGLVHCDTCNRMVAYRENVNDEHSNIVFFNVRPNLSKPILKRNEGENSITFMRLSEVDKESRDWIEIKEAVGTPEEVLRMMNERLRTTMIPSLVTDDKKVIDAVDEAVENLISDFVSRYQEMIEDQQKLIQIRQNIRDEEDLLQRLASTPVYLPHSPHYNQVSPGCGSVKSFDHENEDDFEKINYSPNLFSHDDNSPINSLSVKEFCESISNFSPNGASPDIPNYLLTNTENIPNFQHSYSTIGKTHPPFGNLGYDQPSTSGVVNPSFTMDEQPSTSFAEDDKNWTRNYARDSPIGNNPLGDNSTLNNLMDMINDEERCPMDTDENHISFNFMTQFHDLTNLNSSNNFEEY